MVYDLRSTLETLKPPQVVLLLGYNTALFSLLHRLTGVRCVVNMDGLEWQRPKWSLPVKAWFYFNERIAPKIALRVVADHPVRARDLRNRTTPGRLSMIPYGADAVTEADAALVEKFGLLPDNYLLVVARPEPDNSILEIVQAFSRDRRGVRLCVLGNLDSGRAYHRQVMQAASDEVLFPGACYDRRILEALRFYARFYIHGHRFGGTNPSLVEAMGCGCAVLAHGNPYNRWVAGDAMISFDSVNSCAAAITALLAENTALPGMRVAARSRHSELFTWPHILRSYEDLLLGVL